MLSPKGFEIPDKTFTSDGCSGGFSLVWKTVTGNPPPFEQCCHEHDIEYHYGAGPGSTPEENYRERLDADNQLFSCVRHHKGGGLFWASLLWLGVRIGGGAYWPTPYHWGFGWIK